MRPAEQTGPDSGSWPGLVLTATAAGCLPVPAQAIVQLARRLSPATAPGFLTPLFSCLKRPAPGNRRVLEGEIREDADRFRQRRAGCCMNSGWAGTDSPCFQQDGHGGNTGSTRLPGSHRASGLSGDCYRRHEAGTRVRRVSFNCHRSMLSSSSGRQVAVHDSGTGMRARRKG